MRKYLSFRERTRRNLNRYLTFLTAEKINKEEKRRLLVKWLYEVANVLDPDEIEKILYFIYTQVGEHPDSEKALYRPGIEDSNPTLYRERYEGFVPPDFKG